MNTFNLPQGNSDSYSLGIYDYKLLSKDTFNIPLSNSIRYYFGIYCYKVFNKISLIFLKVIVFSITWGYIISSYKSVSVASL